MIPFLGYAAVATAAMIITGCKESSPEEKTAPKKPSPPSPREAKSQLQSTPLPPAGIPAQSSPDAKAPSFAPIEDTLKGHPLALDAYHLLKQNGASDGEIDQGCHQEKEIQGARDRQIVPCEVYEFSLDHYLGYPLAARKVAEGDLPWNISEWNPFESEKNVFEKKLEETMDHLKRSKGLKDLPLDSPDYRKRLARALFYFVNFPKDPVHATTLKKIWQERTRELTFLGMRDYQDSLFQTGGLGAFSFVNRRGMEEVGTALEALQKNRGQDVSKSNILYAVFKKAGLNPFFTRVQMEYANPNAEIEIDRGERATKYSQDYTAVGVPWKDSALIFHPDAMWELDGDTPHQPYSTLRAYLAEFKYDVGAYYLFYTDDFGKMGDLFRQSLELEPSQAASFNALATALENQKRWDEAEQVYQEGLKVNPNDFFLNWNYADFLENYRKAPAQMLLPYYYRASLDKIYHYYTPQERLPAERAAQKVRKDNPNDPTALKILKVIP